MAILIVDDSPDMCRSLTLLLKMSGFDNVVCASSAHQALQVLAGAPAGTFDVILMDISMPQIDGIEACRRIKALDELNDIPILMVTGLSDEEHLRTAFAAGAIDYITKPVKAAELMARLRSALALKRELDCRKARERELQEVTRRLQKANESLQRLSNIDELTAVANRRMFNQTLEREWARNMRNSAFLSLIMIDIDHFKAYNDYYGHPQGDECLKQVADALRGMIKRPSDLVARYGGEEFAVILPNTHPHGAGILAEGLRKRVYDLNMPHIFSPNDKRVTISLGVAATLPGRAWTPESLISEADRALYQAKNSGRNQVQLFNDVRYQGASAAAPAHSLS